MKIKNMPDFDVTHMEGDPPAVKPFNRDQDADINAIREKILSGKYAVQNTRLVEVTPVTT